MAVIDTVHDVCTNTDAVPWEIGVYIHSML